MKKSLLRAARFVVEQGWLPLARVRLSLSGNGRLARALDGRPCPLAPGIEGQRMIWLADNSPLADGSLGPPEPYDARSTVAEAARVSRRSNSARILYSLAAEYRPRTILELGTNLGISAAYLAAAGGSVTSLEASPYRLRFAGQLHNALGLKTAFVQGMFVDTLADTLKALPGVEMAFIDGHHQYQPTLDYFEQICARSLPGCIFIFDDIRLRKGMWRAWVELRQDSRFDLAADLGGMGVAILGDCQSSKPGAQRAGTSSDLRPR